MWKWRYNSTILDLGTRLRWVVSSMPLPLYPRRKRPWYPLNKGLSGSQSRSGRYGVGKNSCTYREFNPGPPVLQPVARRPLLYRLSYSGNMGRCYRNMQRATLFNVATKERTTLTCVFQQRATPQTNNAHINRNKKIALDNWRRKWLTNIHILW
jgi:hypothetical protein